MTDQMTDQMTNTEPARPDLEGMLRRAQSLSECGLIEAPMLSLFTDALMPVLRYALRLESELIPKNRRLEFLEIAFEVTERKLNEYIDKTVVAQSKLAAMTADREILLHDCVEQMNRADSEKQRADSAEKEVKELRDRIFPPVKSVVITAPMAPALSIQELCAPIAANLSPEQSAGGSEGKE